MINENENTKSNEVTEDISKIIPEFDFLNQGKIVVEKSDDRIESLEVKSLHEYPEIIQNHNKETIINHVKDSEENKISKSELNTQETEGDEVNQKIITSDEKLSIKVDFFETTPIEAEVINAVKIDNLLNTKQFNENIMENKLIDKELENIEYKKINEIITNNDHTEIITTQQQFIESNDTDITRSKINEDLNTINENIRSIGVEVEVNENINTKIENNDKTIANEKNEPTEDNLMHNTTIETNNNFLSKNEEKREEHITSNYADLENKILEVDQKQTENTQKEIMNNLELIAENKEPLIEIFEIVTDNIPKPLEDSNIKHYTDSGLDSGKMDSTIDILEVKVSVKTNPEDMDLKEIENSCINQNNLIIENIGKIEKNEDKNFKDLEKNKDLLKKILKILT